MGINISIYHYWLQTISRRRRRQHFVGFNRRREFVLDSSKSCCCCGFDQHTSNQPRDRNKRHATPESSQIWIWIWICIRLEGTRPKPSARRQYSRHDANCASYEATFLRYCVLFHLWLYLVPFPSSLVILIREFIEILTVISHQ